MKHSGITNTAICGALLFAALNLPTVRADEWDKKTTVTFSDAVQIPGQTLPAGTYIFKLVENRADRYVVQIFNPRENHVYATLLAIPNYHLTTPDHTLISFYEVPSGQAPALKAWFYPGDNYGRQFVYRKSEAEMLAKAANENVPSEESTATAATNESANTQTAQSTDQSAATESTTETNQSTANTETVTPQPATPDNTVTETTTTTDTTVEQQPEPVQQPQPEPQPQATTDDTNTNALPSTSSDWPLVGLIGLGSLLSAFAVRTFANRLS